MKVSELYSFFDMRIPRELSCEWDNDGLMCCADPEREVRRVLLALDITEEIVDLAVKEHCDVIIAHHPLIFRPIKELTTERGVPRKLIKLVRNGIAAMAFHTRLDAVRGGVNDVLAGLLGLRNVEDFGPEGEKMGRIGTLDGTYTIKEYADVVKNTLNAPFVLASGTDPVHRVAVLGGNGDDFIEAALAAGADTFVSGRLGYHPMTDASEAGINLIEAGHYYTERPVLDVLESLVKQADSSVETVIRESCNIDAI